MKIVTVLVSILAVSFAEKLTKRSEPSKKIYECPDHFVRVGRRCYFFSRNTATWQDAFHRCRDRKSSIAIIKTASQDRRIRRILNRPTHAIHERWLGGMYNWKQMKWLWASSGKPLTYHGFAFKNFTENQKWHCIIMDPKVDYKWNTRPCLEEKPYICHTKAKVATKNDLDSYINEIPMPYEGYQNDPSNLREYPTDGNYKYGGNSVSKPSRKRKRNNLRRKKLNDTTILIHRPKFRDTKATGKSSKTTNENRNISIDTIKYEMYKDNTHNDNPLYPKPIVEQYSIVVRN